MYSFKGFWLPFIILNLIALVMTTLMKSMDGAFGILYIGIFYFYNRGYRNAQINHRVGERNERS